VKYYNEKRLHSSLRYQPPMSVYRQCIAANDNQFFEFYCDIAAYKIKQEKDKIKYARLNNQKYVA
jgi:hypothetical protein